MTSLLQLFGNGLVFGSIVLLGSVGLSLLWRDIDDFADDEELATGIGVEVLMGKEWWSDFVGFGLSFGYIAHIDAEVARDLQFAGGSLGLHFSLSFNE